MQTHGSCRKKGSCLRPWSPELVSSLAFLGTSSSTGSCLRLLTPPTGRSVAWSNSLTIPVADQMGPRVQVPRGLDFSPLCLAVLSSRRLASPAPVGAV
jgi:hypothetical protein